MITATRRTIGGRDPIDRIQRLMADGRERTIGDVARDLSMAPDAAKSLLILLTRRKALASCQIYVSKTAMTLWRAA